jgi:hypothetical protein
MAAADVEIVYLGVMRIDKVGKAYFADTPNRTYSQNMEFSEELRVLIDTSVPETAGNPDIRTYLKLMASRGSPHVPVLVSNTIIVTRKSGT